MVRILTVLVTVALALAMALPSIGAETPVYPCCQVATPPTIDGEVRGDDGWANVPAVTGFHALGGGYTLAKQSTARACRDDSALYLSMQCEEPDIGQIEPVLGDGEGLWTVDSVEIFVQPAETAPYYQFVVSAGGARTGSGALGGEEGWDAAAVRRRGGYSVEVKAPLDLFPYSVDEGEWRVAFCRNIWTYDSGGDKFTCWPALGKSFHETSSYARLEMKAVEASADRCARAERALNDDYREHLLGQLSELAPGGAQFMDVLRQAAEDPESPLSDEAREAVMAWRRAQRTAENAEKASLERLREATSASRDLRQRSYQIKYRYLMNGLLESVLGR